jgi:hypothetical protein
MNAFESLLRAEITVGERGSPVTGDMRPLWRLASVVLALRACGRAGKMSLTKLYVINWAVRTAQSRMRFLEVVVNSNATPDDLLIRYDPTLMRAVNLAIGEQLIALESGTGLRLTERGAAFADELERDPEGFRVEREFFSQLRGKVYEKDIARLIRWEEPS